MAFTAYGTPLLPQAATPLAGFTLQNATPTILSYTTPNDGKLHRVFVYSDLVVTSAETGGGVILTFTDPTLVVRNQPIFNGGLAAGFSAAGGIGPNAFTVAPNTTVSLIQNVALSLGAASLTAELWGS